MTTLSIAVSVAVVMLDKIRTEPIRDKRHQLYVDLPLFCIGFLSQSRKPALEVVAARSEITWLTFVILPNDGQLVLRYDGETAHDSPGRSF
jgi:hypothetical protein